MMNSRTRNPPATIANGKTSHQETLMAQYIRNHRPAYGTIVLVTCQSPRHTAGFWYLATMAFQAGGFACPAFLTESESFVIMKCLPMSQGDRSFPDPTRPSGSNHQ